MVDASTDRAVRQQAFDFLSELSVRYGDVFPRSALETGFMHGDVTIPLVSPRGIFKPKVLNLPLSITTSPNSPYNDTFTSDGLLNYCYQGTDPNLVDNRLLRAAMEAGVPLVYLHGILPGKYVAAWPAYIVSDDPSALRVTVAVDTAIDFPDPDLMQDAIVDVERRIRRGYATRETRIRLHQRAFRERVLRAYNTQCAMCRLRHQELLDAAHIIPDSDDEGEPAVSNGLSLCKIHHSAFDLGIVGVRPDCIVEVREDILRETDGPMLRHGIQEMNGVKLALPSRASDRPSIAALERQYEIFRTN